MWITSLQLSNIKSYGPDGQTIPFKLGVNLIQGENGAGKSTILEAIGLALFDRKPYNLTSFVREGARTGRIEVGFFSAHDEREYVIVRAVGGSSQTYVYDPEIKQRVCEGREDTLAFIRQHLQTELDTDLTTFFVDAVGVPQGTMTAIFHETPAVRKEKFNRLLRIDAYETAYENLRETKRYIQERITENDKEQTRLQTTLADLPGLTEAIDRLTGEIAGAEDRLRELGQQLATVAGQRLAADAQRSRLDDLARQVELFAAELRILDERLAAARSAAQEAEAAQAIVVANEAAYRGYQAADQQQAILLSRQQEQQEIIARRHELDVQRELLRNKLERLHHDLEEVATAESELRDLEPFVREQTTLEEDLAQAQADRDAAEREAAELARRTAALADLRERVAACRVRLEAAGLRLREMAKVAEVEAEDSVTDVTRDAVAQLERITDRAEATQATLAREEAGQEALAEEVARGQALQAQLDALRRTMEALFGERRILEARLERLRGDQARQEDYAALLAGAEAVCPVCLRPMDAHAQAQAADHYRQEQARLAAELAVAETDLGQVLERLQQLEAEQAKLQADLRELPGAAGLSAAEQRVQQARIDADNVSEKALRQWELAEAWIAAFHELLVRQEQKVTVLRQSGERVLTLEEQLKALGDPRRRYERAQDRAAGRGPLEQDLQRQEEAFVEVERQLAEVEQQLAAFVDLDTQLEAVAHEKARYEEGYRLYLAHQALAGQLAERWKQVHALEDERKARQAAHDQVAGDYAAMAAGYDAEAHEKLRQQERMLEDEKLTAETRLHEWRNLLQTQQQRLGQLQEAQVQLLALEAEQNRLRSRQEVLEFLREGIRKAGPQITQQLVRMISEQANQIFGDILGDHSMVLEWNEEYGITVSQWGQQREFELLSGGEQMVAAMAVRLALLMHLASVQFAFFDEPTTNLDDARRAQLAESLSGIRTLQQLFVISHDDTFEQASYHVIQVSKEDGLSQVRVL